MRPRLSLALLAGRIASLVSRRLGYGGTVLPGHIVPRLDPHALSSLAAELPHGAIVLSGTNGKTTTTRMIAHIASAAGFTPIHNRSGANLMTGIVAAMTAHTSLSGRPDGDLGVFEVDEAAVPGAVRALRPRVLALTNVFRDQLDRYGEVDLVATRWRSAVADLSADATLVLNADDPTVAHLRSATAAQTLTFGVEDRSLGGAEVSHDADRLLCPLCAARLTYSWTAYSHLGHYACPSCGFHRPHPDITLTRGCIPCEDDPMASRLTVEGHDGATTLRLPLPGLYNAYNALAAAAACSALGIPLSAIARSMEDAAAVFGRLEQVPIGQGSLVLALVKNPVGFNQALRTLAIADGTRSRPDDGRAMAEDLPGPSASLFVIAINDLFADGTDVSWLWDVDFELLAGQPYRFLCTGLRAHDMAVRLKYAGARSIDVQPALSEAVELAARAARDGQKVLVFPTYTAMLELRRELQHRGHVLPFWED